MTRTTLVLVLLIVASFATAAPVPKRLPVTPSFYFTVGTKWEYVRYGKDENVVTEEVVEVEEKDRAIVYKLDAIYSSGKKEPKSFRLAGDELAWVRDGTVEFEPPHVVARSVMKAGDKWELKSVFKMPVQQAIREFQMDGTLVVGKPEQIVTVAGKFDAIPVTHMRGRSEMAVSWYADGVGLVRRTESGRKEPILELKSFTAGKGKK